MAIPIPPITVCTGLEGGSGDVDNVLYQNSTGTTINATINTTGYAAIFNPINSLDSGGSQAMLNAETAGYFNNLAFSLTEGSNNRVPPRLQFGCSLDLYLKPFSLTWNSQNKPTIFATGGARMS